MVEIQYDSSIFDYEKLLEIYWQQIDPTDAGGQFQDRGESYTTAIFVYNEEQRMLAEKSKEQLAASGKFSKPIVTVIRDAETFYEAEDYHQDFYKKVLIIIKKILLNQDAWSLSKNIGRNNLNLTSDFQGKMLQLWVYGLLSFIHS